MKDVTEKNTKKQILSAYEKALVEIRLRAVEMASLRDEVSRATKERLVDKVEGQDQENIQACFKDLAKKISLTFETLEDVYEALEYKRQELKDVHGIIAEADSLAALLDVQKAATEAANIKAAQDQTKHREMLMGLKGESEKALAKIKDEYEKSSQELNYNFKRKNTVLVDEFADRNKKCNREIYEKEQSADDRFRAREEALIRSEKEYLLMKEKVDCYPDMLIDVESKAREVALAESELNHAHALETAEKEMAHLNEKHTTVSDTLKAKLKSLTEENGYLKVQLEVQGEKVNDIATKAIEGASRSGVGVNPYQFTHTTGNTDTRA